MTYRRKTRKKRLRYPPEMAGLAWQSIAEREREALENVVRCAWAGDLTAVKEAMNDLAVTRLRARRKAERDSITDVRRRILVGARLPRAKAEEVRKAAQATGRSKYRFVADAIERELQRCMNIHRDV